MEVKAAEERVRLARSQAVRRRRRERGLEERSLLALELLYEDPLFDSQEGDIETSTAKSEYEDVPLADSLFVQTISDGGRGGLVDNTEDVQATDCTSILGGLTLGVVEVNGGGDNGIGDSATEVRLGSFLCF